MKKSKLYALTYLSAFAFFAIVFGAIFFSAGSLCFWNGWLYWLAFCVPTLVITMYFLQKDPALIERRICPVETRPAQIAGQSIAAVLFLGGIVILPSLDYRFGWTYVHSGISVLSAAAVLIGFIVVFIVFKVNTFTSRAIEHMEGQQFIFRCQTPYVQRRSPYRSCHSASSWLPIGAYSGGPAYTCHCAKALRRRKAA